MYNDVLCEDLGVVTYFTSCVHCLYVKIGEFRGVCIVELLHGLRCGLHFCTFGWERRKV